MQSHRLILEGGPLDAEWLLQWDSATLVLRDANGEPEFEAEPTAAHRVVDLYDLYAEGKISFVAPHGSLVFKKQRAAAAALRELVEAGLADDPEFRVELRKELLWMIPLGSAMFVVCGGLVALYCWYASWAPDPPRGHWIRWLGYVIGKTLSILLGVGLAGLVVIYFGIRQWLRVRRIERAVAERLRKTYLGAAPDRFSAHAP